MLISQWTVQTCLSTFARVSYEAFTVILAIVDVVSDIAIAYTYYQQDMMIFFYFAVAIFLIAQISYVAFFIFNFGERLSRRNLVVYFICLLPFAQTIPLLTWLISFDFIWVNNLLKKLNLHSYGARNNGMHNTGVNALQDPLMAQLSQKLHDHGGFFVRLSLFSLSLSLSLSRC